MAVVALACGNNDFPGLTQRSDVEVHRTNATPDKSEIDPLLADLPGGRLLVHGTDADLASVVLRLLRRELLDSVAVGYIPAEASSVVADLWDLPARDPGRALELAVDGDPDRVPLIRDDVGGVLLGRGVLGPLRGVVYCDDELVLRGQAGRLEVTPDPGAGEGLAVRTVRRSLFGGRGSSATGRAVQIGCLPTRVVRDGITHPRPVNKWIWYRHTVDLRLVRGVV
ncbi:hypothetical protein BKA25_000212 [Actinoalloteichus hymeniacidonis]|uniref:Uncharacterized protein n=1 Tax=Actinoalloteichus hymeniacidonis TaxID=340345 RepID=A0AAC9N1C0_9PSEU|nr:hypothetical protein TL08_26165 [Actinoalloteichus hymeniacidonis]MBB5905896.1 hypothetical protein [Actinoalloteichus hymeniacidonis]